VSVTLALTIDDDGNRATAQADSAPESFRCVAPLAN
jgi:hypothetical protein